MAQVECTLCEKCKEWRLDSDFLIGDGGVCKYCKGHPGPATDPNAELVRRVNEEMGYV